jgi:tetratricopeptide (TPR) repeat protein
MFLYVFIAISLGPLLSAQAAAQELNPLERALPCKTAGEQAEAKINNTTNADTYKTALSDLRSSVDSFVARTGETDESSLHCLNFYGGTLLHLGEYGSSADVYRRAVKLARAPIGPDDDSTLTLQGNLAVALLHVGALDEAAQLQQDTLKHREVLSGTPKQHKLAITIFNLAMIQSARGEIATAKALADRGWAMAQLSISTEDPRWSTVLDNYAMVLDQSGSRSQAQEFYERALAERLKRGDREAAVESLSSLAASFYDMGRFEEADARYREAYRLAKEAFPPLHPTVGEIARSWCRVLSSVNTELEESLARCDEALRIQSAHAEDGKLQMYLTEVNRGATLGEMERYPEAIQSLQDALYELQKNFPSYVLEIIDATRSLGIVFIGAGRIPEGATLLANALEKQTSTLGAMHPDVLETQGNYGVALAMEGKFQESEAILADYAKKSDVLRELYGRDERATQGVFSRYASTRTFLAKILINEGRCREAFDWIEETKARSLRDQIREHALFGGADEQDRELFSSLNEARKRLYIERARSAGDGAKETAVDARLRAVNAQIGQLIDKAHIRQNTAGGQVQASSAVRERFKGTNTVAVAFGLVEQEVLVASYKANSDFQCKSLGDWPGLYETLWTTHVLQANPQGMAGVLAGSDSVPASRIVRTGFRSFQTISRAAPIPAVATIENSADNILGSVGEQLFGWLLTKAGASNRLVLSPDGMLGIVSMDALLMNGQPLVSRYSISQVDSFVPAGHSANENADAQKSPPISMVAFGDPVYGANTSPQTIKTAVRKARLLLRGNYEQTAEWPILPASGPELRALADLYHMTPGKTVFARDLATVKNLEALNADGTLMRTRFLVFSAHGFADVSDPELSSIVLSAPQGGSARDAYFTAIEIGSLRLNSDLVFFSACETGFGQVITGEGVLSLSSAALAAGARATVHTLWSVPDATSAAFTKKFFTALRGGQSPEQAITETKRAFLRDKEHSLPAYWAPYVLVQR